MAKGLKALSMRHLEESIVDDTEENKTFFCKESQSSLPKNSGSKKINTEANLNVVGMSKEDNEPLQGTSKIPAFASSVTDSVTIKAVNNKKGRSLSMDKDIARQVVKGESVKDHPLARRPSSSSISSQDGDYEQNGQISEHTTTPSRTVRSRGSSLGGFHLHDESSATPENSVDGGSGGGYYTASSLWHNRGKIFTNLKKQATDGVRRNLPGLTHSSTFDVSIPDVVDTESQQTETPQKSDHSGLIKVDTEKIVESREDTEVTSFLHGLQKKVVDPLQLLYYKKKEDDEKKEEMDDYSHDIQRKSTRTLSDAGEKVVKKTDSLKDISSVVHKPSGDAASSLSMSLSALLGGVDQTDEDIVDKNVESDVGNVTSGNVEVPINKDTELCQNSDLLNNNDTKVDKSAHNTSSELLHIEEDNETPSYLLVSLLVLLVYMYFVFPVPTHLQVIVNSFLCGTVFSTVFLCIVAPQSTRPKPFLTSFVNKSIPNEVPKNIYNPEQPIKGWMNESQSYDPELYHVSNTHSVFVTLDRNTMRLQTPHKSIPRRSIYNEGSTPVSNVVYQRLYDVTNAKVFLKPDGLVKKRVWSKKYPICVEIPVKTKPEGSPVASKNSTEVSESDATKSTIIVYLFGRTDRQKEEWFYRIQRSINLAILHQKQKAKAEEESKQQDEDENSPIREDEWGVIENHYEEETFVASTLCKVDTINTDPMKAYRDYFLHVSRLFPEVDQQKGEVEKGIRDKIEMSDDDTAEPGLEVAWMNVFVGRVMFDFLRQESWAKWLSIKIQKKLDKIKLPYFMEELKLTEMNLGDTVPLIHQISLPKIDSQGTWMDMEITYSGSLQMTLKTKMILTKLGKQELESDTIKQSWKKTSAITDSDAEDSAESSDDDDDSPVTRFVDQVQTAVPQIVKDAVKYVGTETGQSHVISSPNPKKWVRIMDSITKSKYFKKAAESEYIRKKLETVSNTPMLLSVELLELKGTLAVNIAPPPTDRVWYGFREPPHIVLKAHPKVGERVVKTSHVTDWIENKLQQEFIKVLVMPNMDDIPIPIMFNNR
uniref:Testis-expressed sequence 2 protein-like n=1 Tax=Phallusia mammillata TaxID=59560 RepID=A0A6F9DVK8_9ASCI|nr:testis-expressed sequence 2 protein-like [Phallusia mammillata]